jgi:hypothetical protein
MIEIFCKGKQRFRVTFYLDPKVWKLQASVLYIYANTISDVTYDYIVENWQKENHQPFGLEDGDIVKFIVERM